MGYLIVTFNIYGCNVHLILGDEQKALLKELLSQVKATLKRDDIHDANRAVLSILVEELLQKIDVIDKVNTS
jgi:hypothetical protein